MLLELGIIATRFSIVLGAHMVSCVWYAVGSSNGQMACDDLNVTDKYDQTCVMTEEKGMQREMRGWVDRQEYAEHTPVGAKCECQQSQIITMALSACWRISVYQRSHRHCFSHGR